MAVLIILSLPVVWSLRRYTSLEQWTLIGVSTIGLYVLHPVFILALMGFAIAMYVSGRQMQIGRTQHLYLWGGLGSLVCFLFLAKYWRPSLAHIFASFGFMDIGLPLGLSYFVLRFADVHLRFYRQELPALSFRDYLCYLLFPATIPAGPLEGIDAFYAKRLKRLSIHDIAWGTGRIIFGIAKKVILADLLIYHLLIDPSASHSLLISASMDPLAAPRGIVISLMLASLVYSYADFSAYSDIAIGLSRLYGYRISENFNYPLTARNLRDFWRRWHITASSWTMRNIYLPVAVATRRQIPGLFAAMIFMGLWHELSLSWMSWGVYHAVGLSVLTWYDRRTLRASEHQHTAGWRRLLATILTLLFVAAGHSFVLVHDFPTSVHLFAAFWKTFLP